VLVAEVAWESGRPSVARVKPDYPLLVGSHRPIGLAIRVGPFSGPFSGEDQNGRSLTELASKVLAEARAAGCEPAELQLDFDCATSKLDGYTTWVRTIAKAITPTPLTITALPTWLTSPALGPLVQATSGFVLQVHSLDRPRLDDPAATLCDTAAARRWAEQANGYGVPFRVALPTYGYLVSYDAQGNVLGFVAEADAPAPPQATTLREVSADPTSLSGLVHDWSQRAPTKMTGVIWYRLPVADDRLNWSWVTLASVMKGMTPLPHLVVRQRRPEPGLVEISAANTGDADAPMPDTVKLTWSGSLLIASDALAGMESEVSAEGVVTLRPPKSAKLTRIRPGQERQIGWIRLAKDVEVTIDAIPKPAK
jgi:hypothetical protein